MNMSDFEFTALLNIEGYLLRICFTIGFKRSSHTYREKEHRLRQNFSVKECKHFDTVFEAILNFLEHLRLSPGASCLPQTSTPPPLALECHILINLLVL